MLPIKLKIDGLNSYARKAVVDFTRFYNHMLFGIFGDTAGGKSAILDAIVLSLYGRTPRLSKQSKKKLIKVAEKLMKLINDSQI